LEPQNESTFGQRVKETRKRLKLMQKEFAEKLEIADTTLSDIETGKHKPGYDFYYNIVSVYNVNLYYLFFGKGEMFLNPNSFSQDFTFAIDGDDSEISRDVREFFHYFSRSKLVRYMILGYFRKILHSENEAISIDMNSLNQEKNPSED